MNTSSHIPSPSSSPSDSETESVHGGPSTQQNIPKKINTTLPNQSKTKDALKVAFSSPNLKDLNNSADPESQHWLEGYLAGKLEDNSGSSRPNYVDPLYEELNVGSKPNKPVWSLSGPLPHVLGNSVVEKISQKNQEVRSRASTRPNSRLNSRVNSSASLAGMDGSANWKQKMKNAVFGSRVKLNDEEAQMQNEKPSASMVEQADSNPKVNFSLQGSRQPSIADRQNQTQREKASAITIEHAENVDSRPKVSFSKQNSRQSYVVEEEPNQADSPVLDKVIDEDTLNSGSENEILFPNYWCKIRHLFREGFAEFLGTLVLVVFGVGSNLQATVTKGAGGSFESLSFAWGFGCMLGVYIAGGISGGHINPAVTISLAIFRKFPWYKVPIYIFFQIWGAFFGGALAYGYHWSSITEFEGGKDIRTPATGGCLFTNPKPYVTWRNAFFDEFIGTAVLVGCLLAILDDTNSPPTQGMTAFIVGLLIAAIGMALGYQTSFTLNPARDLGPRMFAWWIGYGPHAFHLYHWWWTWGAWGGTIGGGIAGGLIYDLVIFTGPESPINYPDNGFIDKKVKQITSRFDKDMEMKVLERKVSLRNDI
ncbi:Aquaglycerol porin aqy3 [Schizosaccharomyces pombe]